MNPVITCWFSTQSLTMRILASRIFPLNREAKENDIAALCLSFLICQSLRYHTSGQLPDPEGNEPPATRRVSSVPADSRR